MPCDFERYGEDGFVFIVGVFSGEVCSGEPFHSVMANLFGNEVFWFPFVDVVYCAVGKVFACVDFHGVQGVVDGMLWFGEILRYGWWGSF